MPLSPLDDTDVMGSGGFLVDRCNDERANS